MTKEQASHVAAMAQKVKQHAQKMVNSMDTLLVTRLLVEYDVPVSQVKQHFAELEHSWSEIQGVLHDMLPRLEE